MINSSHNTLAVLANYLHDTTDATVNFHYGRIWRIFNHNTMFALIYASKLVANISQVRPLENSYHVNEDYMGMYIAPVRGPYSLALSKFLSSCFKYSKALWRAVVYLSIHHIIVLRDLRQLYRK